MYIFWFMTSLRSILDYNILPKEELFQIITIIVFLGLGGLEV